MSCIPVRPYPVFMNKYTFYIDILECYANRKYPPVLSKFIEKILNIRSLNEFLFTFQLYGGDYTKHKYSIQNSDIAETIFACIDVNQKYDRYF